MGKMQDVWFVTNWQAIQWMREPTPISHLSSFEPWGCKHKVRTCQVVMSLMRCPDLEDSSLLKLVFSISFSSSPMK